MSGLRCIFSDVQEELSSPQYIERSEIQGEYQGKEDIMLVWCVCVRMVEGQDFILQAVNDGCGGKLESTVHDVEPI